MVLDIAVGLLCGFKRCTIVKEYCLQFGQPYGVVFDKEAEESSVGGLVYVRVRACAKALRSLVRDLALLALVKNPRYRILRKVLGKTCIKNRRVNSLVESVTTRCLFLFRRSRALKVTVVVVCDMILEFDIAIR